MGGICHFPGLPASCPGYWDVQGPYGLGGGGGGGGVLIAYVGWGGIGGIIIGQSGQIYSAYVIKVIRYIVDLDGTGNEVI